MPSSNPSRELVRIFLVAIWACIAASHPSLEETTYLAPPRKGQDEIARMERKAPISSREVHLSQLHPVIHPHLTPNGLPIGSLGKEKVRQN